MKWRLLKKKIKITNTSASTPAVEYQPTGLEAVKYLIEDIGSSEIYLDKVAIISLLSEGRQAKEKGTKKVDDFNE